MGNFFFARLVGIDETAKILKQQLKDVGLYENQEKKITVSSHSAGGLLARWFIEQEDGNTIFKHLIIAGTPSNGTAFGNIAAYRNMAITALTLSLNFLKPYIPFASLDSIKHIDEFRKPGPEKIDIVCHHLNYFESEASLKALANVFL